MSLIESAAYLKGLADGMELDESKKENKLLKSIIDVINDIAISIDELEGSTANIESELDEVAEELLSIEHAIDRDCDTYDDDYDDWEDDCDCDDCDCDGTCDCEEYYYSVVCGNCGDEITVDESIIELGKIQCPNCGEELEFDMDYDEDCDDCDCCN